ncbi:DUF2461 domain-containing protein [Ulvibacterium sp.]|uniref:DUF2461 domain-containing protein n=1 Tax=Ulvibacterium sp. TaxID=2665914 RepID=UPI00260531A5|nr:DUF2461 domain-containing protein [Ulvibacterium sp.]
MITPAYISFFKELQKNNHKEWFHTNKKRYENDVKAPFLSLLDEILPVLTQWDDRIPTDSKKAMFRINRDVRFSKDKSPYNLIMKAGFSPNGKKSELPGYYLGIDAENIHVGGGLFMIRTPQLKRIRNLIASRTGDFLDILANQEFKNAFGQLKGEKAKRLDKSLISTAEKTEHIYNKQFYAFAEFPIEPFFGSDGLTDEILSHFKAIKPLNSYLDQSFE